MNDNKNEPFGYNRRDFLKSGSFASLMTMMGGVELFAQPATTPAPETKEAGQKIKVGVIGLGARGREILSALSLLEPADVAAVCDTYGAFLRRSSKFAPNAKKIEDYKAIIDDKEIKAVIVATPTHKHKEIVLAALKAGKHVYCEAPIANTVEDARKIALAAKAAKTQIFQSGLQMRSDPQRIFLLPFIRSGALGKTVLARAQSHEKKSWRTASSDPDQEKALNWRLDKSVSIGLAGEIGIHQIDQACWFLNSHPLSVTGFGSLIRWTEDGREVPDTVQAVFEFPAGVRVIFDGTIANSFDADHEIYYGTDAAVMLRESKAWMFKEVDSPLLGWEVYAKKDTFFKESGIVLALGSSKQTSFDQQAVEVTYASSTLSIALNYFLRNSLELGTAEQTFVAGYGSDDPDALMDHLAKVRAGQHAIRPIPGHLEGFQSAVTAIKANEAIVAGKRLDFKPEWYELG